MGAEVEVPRSPPPLYLMVPELGEESWTATLPPWVLRWKSPESRRLTLRPSWFSSWEKKVGEQSLISTHNLFVEF
jgi:hypothetical protein